MMSDLIKREDAIKAVAQDLMYESCVQSEYASDELSDWIEVAKVMLEEVPSADRPQGEWIFRREFVEDTPFTGYRCSNCNYWQGMGAWNFCPNCGCRMKGADDE
jgi:hypothetical protein